MNVAQTITASARAERLWSHVHSNGISTAYGNTTQSHAEPKPIPRLKTRFPIPNMGKHVAAENAQFIIWLSTVEPNN
jgi:hypothetical protein